jgi:hypothetical protein
MARSSVRTNGHQHPPTDSADGTERCPWCGSRINRVAFAAVQKRIAEQERARVAQETARIEAHAKAQIERAQKEAARIAEQQIRAARASLESTIAEQLDAQRESLDRTAAKAVADEKNRAYQEKLKLEAKVRELARQLEGRRSTDLGEEGEVDLLDALRREFPTDIIERVGKGQKGADIIHSVVHNTVVVGKVVYDVKNVSRFLSRYVDKLRSDQHDADFAVLAINSLPGDVRHFAVVDSILVAQPARVPALVSLLRRHIIAMHVVNLGNQNRTEKTAALLRFVASPAGRDMLGRIPTLTSEVEDIRAEEARSQQQAAKKIIQKMIEIRASVAEYAETIDGIIGIGRHTV